MKINRQQSDKIVLAVADGVLEVGKEMIRQTQPPDAPPLGEGLVRHGGTIVYIGKKKVAEWSTDGSVVKKPRALKLGGENEVVGAAGYPVPARWDEMGTVHQPARPFFAPAAYRVAERAPGLIKQAAKYRIARLRG